VKADKTKAFLNPTQPDELNAGSFHIVDSKGRRRATLGLTEDDDPVLRFFDPNGALQLSIAASADGPVGMVLFDRAGAARIAITTLTAGTPAVELLDEAEEPRARITLTRTGDGSIQVVDATGATWAMAPPAEMGAMNGAHSNGGRGKSKGNGRRGDA
jgi:hypothetical protein